MTKTTKPKSETPRKQRNPKVTEHEARAQKATEDDPAVERGERIATGKIIAQGGTKKGFVPGASEQK